MPDVRRGPIPSELGWLVDLLDSYADRLRTLETPSGEALSNTVATLQALVTDIQAQLDAYIAGKYTNAQIDAKDAAVQANILPTLAANNVTVGGAFYNPPGYSFDITYTRRTAWLGNDGRLGYASSAMAGKTAIRPAELDTDALLDLEPRSFIYRREVARRTSLRINEGVDYRPAREVGLLAHEVDKVAPWLVYHDDDGNAEGVEYSMLTVALLAAARNERRARLELEARVAKLEGATS
jgi:hypothetical protein